MDKRILLDLLVERLKGELEATRKASKEAASYATDEEAKADSKWDTQGLEASYLAAGQAGHAAQLGAALQTLQGDRAKLTAPRRVGEMGALMACTIAGETDWYFLAPVAGGEVVSLEGTAITVITPGSPLFVALRGHSKGQRITLPSGAILEVTALE
jgi:hypothetical protein